MVAIQIHPKYQKTYKISVSDDYNKLLGSSFLDTYLVKPGVTMVIPKIYNDNHGFALGSFKEKLIFSKAIFIADSEEKLKTLQLEIFWLGNNLTIKQQETKRIAFFA